MTSAERPEPRWQPSGIGVGWRSNLVLAAVVTLGLIWLCWPIWHSMSSPIREEAGQAAPLILIAVVAMQVLLAVAVWLDAGRDFGPVTLALTLLLLNTALRVTLNPGASGVEIVHALPLLAGMCAGAPAGFLVGAGGMLLSSALIDSVGDMLPAQLMILGLVGALGGVLWRIRPLAAWLLSLPLAVFAGVGSGMLLNLMGWSQEPGTTTTSFFPGVPPAAVVQRLWAYTVETSLLVDLTRGVTTAVLLLLVGLPLLRASQAIGVRPVALPAAADRAVRLDPTAVSRRRDRDRLDTMWKTGDHS